MTEAESRLLSAHKMYQIMTAWSLHCNDASAYNAWENNFALKGSLQSFKTQLARQQHPHNQALRLSALCRQHDIPESEWIKLVVVNEPNTSPQEMLRGYSNWVTRMSPIPLNEGSLMMWNGMPHIMQIVHNKSITPLRAAENITKSKAWDQLWSLRDESNFMFDIVWPTIHRYRPLFKEYE